MTDNASFPTLPELVAGNTYPGRGAALGFTPAGRAALAYFIMGRSDNSRDRVFVRDGGDVHIARFSDSSAGDPSLVIYSPVRALPGATVVTNGDQTETVCSYLLAGSTFASALMTRAFEPDAPNFTPRISGMIAPEFYALSILKAGDTEGRSCQRQFFRYEPLPGTGHLIHTYMCDGAPLPSFTGEPRAFALGDDIGALAASLWAALDRGNRVSLYVRFISPSGETEDRLYNERQGGIV